MEIKEGTYGWVPIRPSKPKQAIFRTGFDFTVFFSGILQFQLVRSLTRRWTNCINYYVITLFSIYVLKQWIVFFARSDWLLNQWISCTIHWFTSSSSERAMPNSRKLSCEQNAFPVSCRKQTKKFHNLSSKLFPKYTEKVTKFELEVFTGKALSFWHEFIDKTGEKVFCLQMEIKFKSCVTLFSWVVHK